MINVYTKCGNNNNITEVISNVKKKIETTEQIIFGQSYIFEKIYLKSVAIFEVAVS